MADQDTDFLENLSKYGPKKVDNIFRLEETAALAAGRKPKSREELMGQKMLAMAGDPEARKKNEKLMQEIKELGDQYKREAKGSVASSSIPYQLRSALGFKHGGKVSTSKTNKKQARW